MKKIRLFIILLLTISLSTFSQTFERSEKPYLKENYTQYHNLKAGIIILKVKNVEKDSTTFRYEIGLSIFTMGRSIDDFMKQTSVVVFEDNTHLLLYDNIYVNYFQEGKHQYSIKHKLSENEFEIFQSKKIDFFLIAEKKKQLDKWLKEDVLNAFKKITTQ